MTRPAGAAEREIKPDDPLLLRVAAERAYPDGSMTAAGLRRLAARGLLDIERTNGRDYTTLADIEEMRRRCRDQAKARVSISASEPVERPSGKSADLENRSAQAAAKATVQALKDSLKSRSRSDTGRGSQIVPIRRRSATC